MRGYSGPPTGQGQFSAPNVQPEPETLERDKSQRAFSKKDPTEGRYNLLSCLAAAQQCNIDFTGISWVEAQPTLGRGGQALVCETRASLDTVLAFKRRSPEANDKESRKPVPIPPTQIDAAFREVASEIWVMGQSVVKNHLNIVRLEAICWEIIQLPDKKSEQTPGSNFGELPLLSDLALHGKSAQSVGGGPPLGYPAAPPFGNPLLAGEIPQPPRGMSPFPTEMPQFPQMPFPSSGLSPFPGGHLFGPPPSSEDPNAFHPAPPLGGPGPFPPAAQPLLAGLNNAPSESAFPGHPIFKEPRFEERSADEPTDSEDANESDRDRNVQVWPVLIFERARWGNLEFFMKNKDAGKQLDLTARLKICDDIASALEAIHAIGIIHGDVKPRNALVFGSNPNDITTKLSDFGYSTAAASSKKCIELPVSFGWAAPELEQEAKYTLEEARWMDLYSFGVLCLWVLFWEKLAEMNEHLPEGERTALAKNILAKVQANLEAQAQRNPKDQDSVDIVVLQTVNTMEAESNKTLEFALDLASSVGDLKPMLEELFQTVLSLKPRERSNIKEIRGILARGLIETKLEFDPTKDANSGILPEVSSAKTDNASGTINKPPPAPVPTNFHVSTVLQSLCQADYRVRSHIFHCLRDEVDKASSAEEKANAAFQVAFCTKVGFGTQKRIDLYTELLATHPELSEARLQEAIEATRPAQPIFNEDLKRLYDRGVIQPVHHAEEHREQISVGDHKHIKALRRREIKYMASSLGETHLAVLNLKWTYGAFLANTLGSGPSKHWAQMVKDLEADSSYKPNSLEVLVTKAYKAMSLAPIPDSLESNESLLRECYKALAEAGHDAHVVCLMLCRILAQSLDMRGRTTEASRYYERARQGTKDTFGNDHANTFIINAIQSSLYIRQGRIEEAEDIARETLNGLSRLIGKDSIGLVPALGELMAILATQGKVSEAAEVNERTRTILLTKFHENDPTLYPVRSAEIDILLEQERYDEATNKLSILLAELASLLGINLHGELPRLKIPLGPQDIGSPPAVAMLYGSYAAYATALHAQGLPSAEDYMLKVMLAAYRNFDSESWTNLSPTGGWGGSALCTAMEQDLCPYLELLLCLGMKNKQDGSHYAQAISIAQRENLPKIEALLEEHQLLCYGALTSIPFKDCESLGVFINGDWTGSYMYADGGPRKDPKGKRTVTISATLSDGKYDSVAIEGTAQDDMGSWIVTGEGQVSGDLVLFFYPEESSPEHAWEYRGRVNVQRNAMGGAWGIRGLLDTRPGGTFFYFKS